MFQAVRANKNVCAIIHRRAGKDICCLRLWLIRALERVGTHVYLFPLQKQAREVIWHGMDFDGKPFLSAIPPELIVKKNEARMEIELFNGSRMVLAGSNNYDGLMGTNPLTIIYSEFSLHNPLARQYLNPILIQNDGLEIINSTPRGMNHLYEVYNTVRENPNYHVEHLSILETTKCDGSRIISEEQANRAKEMGMSDEMFRQELMCDFEVGNLGAYYTKEMEDMAREKRITTLKPNPRLPLHSVWDLGGTDATAGCLFQIDGTTINILYTLTDSHIGLKPYLEEADKYRQSVGCQWGHHYAPHDIKQGHQGWEHAESRLVQARKHGWHFQVTPKVNFEDGIEAARFCLPKVRMDKNNCAMLIRALREYQRKYNEGLSRFETKPLHNWASHYADMFRYLSVNYRRLFDVHTAPVKYKYGK